MTRITSEMNTTQEILTVMGGANPGALSFMMECIKKGTEIDPQSALGGFGPLLLADTFEIYDEKLYGLWNDLCGRDLVKAIGLLRACQLGILGRAELKQAIDDEYQHTLKVDEIVAQVKERLSGFGSNVETSPLVEEKEEPSDENDDD